MIILTVNVDCDHPKWKVFSKKKNVLEKYQGNRTKILDFCLHRKFPTYKSALHIRRRINNASRQNNRPVYTAFALAFSARIRLIYGTYVRVRWKIKTLKKYEKKCEARITGLVGINYIARTTRVAALATSAYP